MYTSDAQFGLTASHGTEMATFSIKETGNIYSNSGPPNFVCFLDATKHLRGYGTFHFFLNEEDPRIFTWYHVLRVIQSKICCQMG